MPPVLALREDAALQRLELLHLRVALRARPRRAVLHLLHLRILRRLEPRRLLPHERGLALRLERAHAAVEGNLCGALRKHVGVQHRAVKALDAVRLLEQDLAHAREDLLPLVGANLGLCGVPLHSRPQLLFVHVPMNSAVRSRLSQVQACRPCPPNERKGDGAHL